MSQAEMDAVLDALEIKNDDEVIDNPPEEVVDEPIDDPIDEVLDPVDEPQDDPAPPPGFMDYDEWVAKGKDPKQYRGEDAYKAEYNRIQDNKDMKSQIDGLQDTMRQVVSSTDEWKVNQTANIRADLVAEFNAAKEAGEMDDALDAQSKINELDKAPKAQPVQPTTNNLTIAIDEFRTKNPLTDSNNPRFNAEYEQDFRVMFNNELGAIDSGNGFTDAQIARTLKSAKQKADARFPELFESPRNARKTPPRGAKKPAAPRGTDWRAKLQALNGGGRNKRDNTAHTDLYDDLLTKKGGGKDSADMFAKAILGE